LEDLLGNEFLKSFRRILWGSVALFEAIFCRPLIEFFKGNFAALFEVIFYDFRWSFLKEIRRVF
jgi:hypothetical protein